MYNNFKVCRFFIKFLCSLLYSWHVYGTHQSASPRRLPGLWVCYQATAGAPRVNNGRFCPGHMSGQLRHVEQGKGCDCQLLNHAGPWDQSHGVTRQDGARFRGCGSVEGEVLGKWGGWLKREACLTFLGGVRSLRLSNPRGQTLSLEEGMHWCLDGILLFLCGKTHWMPPSDMATIFWC